LGYIQQVVCQILKTIFSIYYSGLNIGSAIYVEKKCVVRKIIPYKYVKLFPLLAGYPVRPKDG